MEATPIGQPDLVEAFLKSAQYVARIKRQQDLWEHAGRLIVTHFPPEWVAFGHQRSGGGISIYSCTSADPWLNQALAGAEVRALVGDVLESGFLISEAIIASPPTMTALLPIIKEYQTQAVMLVGHGTADPLSADLLNVYLALAGLVGTAWERLQNEAELIRHRAYLEEQVEERTRELREAQQELAGLNEELQARNQDLQSTHAEAARLLEEQRALFHRLQEALLDIPRELPGVGFGHLYRSATREAQIGGDFYDVFRAKNGRIGLLIGDVSGHGIEAARIATLLKDTVHAFAQQFRHPYHVLRETNRLLVEKGSPGFVTAFLGLLDAEHGTLTYSSAGHPPPMLCVRGRVTLLESPSLPLGAFADSQYRDTEAELEKGSLLLFYTDGITEARRDGELFGEDRLAASLGRLWSGPIEALPSLLLEEVVGFSGGLLRDDAALLAVSYLAEDPPVPGANG